MRLRSRRQRREGTVTVESTVVVLALLTMILGMLDLGLAVFQYHVVSEAARQGARLAIVHGQMAPSGWNGGSWGPTTINKSANTSGTPLVDEIKPLLVSLDLTQTTIKAEWLDGGNAPENRVRVTVSTTFQSSVTFIFGGSSLNLSASSTMPIAH
jgi:Flp pilus assembly protein TadG